MNGPFGHIDGETPIDDVSDLIPNIGTRRELNQHEAKNVSKAIIKYLVPERTGHEFELAWIKSVHMDMFRNVWKWAGTYRRENLSIGISWQEVETQLFDLCQSIPYFKQPPADDDIAYLHHRLVVIHPFRNGNGRWARLVSSVYQLHHTGTYLAWPPDSAETNPIREQYLDALKTADAGDLSKLINLHVQFTRKLPVI